MTHDEKPSKQEDEYFMKLDQELLRQQRARREVEEAERERAASVPRCPRDGDGLEERDLEGVKVDVCPRCNGIWLDAGELETLRRADQKGFSRFFGGLLGR